MSISTWSKFPTCQFTSQGAAVVSQDTMASILLWPKTPFQNHRFSLPIFYKWYVRKAEIPLCRKFETILSNHLLTWKWTQNCLFFFPHTQLDCIDVKSRHALWLSNTIWVGVLCTISRIDPWNFLYPIICTFSLSFGHDLMCMKAQGLKNTEPQDKRNPDL